MQGNGRGGVQLPEVIINYSELVSNNQVFVRDVWFVSYNLEVLITLIISLLLAWLFHEAMHYIIANKYKLMPVYGWDRKGSFVSLKRVPSYDQQIAILEGAVLMGCIPILLCFFNVGLWMLIPLGLYLVGCGSDLLMIVKVRGVIRRFRR
jgi:hypothetical protein